MEHSVAPQAANAYTTRLDRTLKALQDRVKEQEAILEELRAASAPIDPEPSEDPKVQLQQLRALTLAYTSLTPQEPFLPSRESPIPALIALRVTDTTIKETQDAITKTEASLKEVNKRLEKEKTDLEDADLIQKDLLARIEELRGTIEERTQKSSSQIAKDMIREVKKKKAYYDSETTKLVKAFNAFINEHLAAMLAVEELGGPIAGEIQEIDDEMLESGYSAQGKIKRVKPTEDKRQRRIDQIWGKRPDEGDHNAGDKPWDEKRAAATEMRELIEELLNSLVEAGGNGPGAYVELNRESAAARFLVRSKVAQFHPKDARKLRLFDFGGEIDD